MVTQLSSKLNVNRRTARWVKRNYKDCYVSVHLWRGADYSFGYLERQKSDVPVLKPYFWFVTSTTKTVMIRSLMGLYWTSGSEIRINGKYRVQRYSFAEYEFSAKEAGCLASYGQLPHLTLTVCLNIYFSFDYRILQCSIKACLFICTMLKK